MRESNSYHVSKDGFVRPCHATKRSCPNGQFTFMYKDVQGAQLAASALNSQLEQFVKQDQMGFAVQDGNIVPTQDTIKAIYALTKFDLVSHKIRYTLEHAKKEITSELERNEVENGVSIKEFDIAYRKSTKQTRVDSQKLKEAGLFDKYSKETKKLKEKITLDYPNRPDDSTTYDLSEQTIPFELHRNEKGQLVASQKTLKALRQLKEFQEQLERLEELRKELNQELLNAMKEANIQSYKLGKVEVIYKPEHSNRIVDTQSLRKDGLYDVFSKRIDIKSGITIKYA